MEHQGQRNGEGGHHDQRIGCDEEVRRLECKKMRPSWRGHCPHGDCHDEVSDSEKAPGVCCPVRANYVSCQQRSHDDGNDARRDVSSATSARSSGVRLPFLTRLKSSGLPTATRCRIFRIMPRVAGVSGRSRTRPILLRPSPINVARWLQSRRIGLPICLTRMSLVMTVLTISRSGGVNRLEKGKRAEQLSPSVASSPPLMPKRVE